jgi:hypothetical protein
MTKQTEIIKHTKEPEFINMRGVVHANLLHHP